MTTQATSLKPSYPWRWILLGLGVFISVIAAVMLLFNTWNTPVSSSSDEIKALNPNQVRDMLLRSGYVSNRSDADVLYAPSWYFDWNNRELPVTDRPVLAFFVLEEIHEGVLEVNAPEMFLVVDGQQFAPLETKIVSDAPHHRVTQVLFSALDGSDKLLIDENSEEIVLVSPIDGQITSANTYHWKLPLPYGLGLLNTGESVTDAAKSALTFAGFIAIMGGMLSALSPCLLQLAVYYTAVLASNGAEAGSAARQIARTQVIKTSLYFVGGFTIVYTLGGIIAGYVGQSLEKLDVLDQWLRPISVVSGIVIIMLAVRVAIQSKAPLVCRMPIRINHGTGWWSSTLMGLSFAVGCTSCFSATVLSALLIYVGSTGSPVIGGLVLFLFSTGIGLIFLLAAWVLGEATPEMGDWLRRRQPIIGGLSALVMVAFGVLMVTYQFHLVSGYLMKIFGA